MVHPPFFKSSNIMKFFYGIVNNYVDITDIVKEKCIINDCVCIPAADDDRALIFQDPVYGKVKHILVLDDHDQERIFPAYQYIMLNLFDGKLDFTNKETFQHVKRRQNWWQEEGKFMT